MNKQTKLINSNMVLRLADCKGAVHLAIDGILSQDPEKIDAAVSALILVERELKTMQSNIEAVDNAQARARLKVVAS